MITRCEICLANAVVIRVDRHYYYDGPYETPLCSRHAAVIVEGILRERGILFLGNPGAFTAVVPWWRRFKQWFLPRRYLTGAELLALIDA